MQNSYSKPVRPEAGINYASLELTVSMPARNTASYIVTALESVLSQEGVSFEVIVIDDGSDDDTGEKARSISDSRVQFYRNETPRGIGWCHNFSLGKSRAPFLACAPRPAPDLPA